MAQDPFNVDQLQINPGSAVTILINDTAGALTFQDGVVTGGITLAQLAGLRSVGNVMVVGKSGAGAEYTTIQSALDDIPASSSLSNPYFVLIGPGQYRETINIVRDGVFIRGFGAVVQSLGEAVPNGPDAYHTMVIQSGLGTTPLNLWIEGLTVTNAHDNFAPVRISGGAASTLGSNLLVFANNNILSTSVAGGRVVWATSSNNILVSGGSMSGTGANSLTLVEECAAFTMQNVLDPSAFQLDYDSTGTLPSIATCEYRILDCPDLGRGSSLSPPLASTLSGAGSLLIKGCNGGKALTVGGDRTLVLQDSHVGALTLNGTTAATITGGSHGAVVGAVGTTLAEPVQQGTETFAAATAAVTFDVEHPDANYTVLVECRARPVNDETPWITGKLATGFTINFQTAQTLECVWSVFRV